MVSQRVRVHIGGRAGAYLLRPFSIDELLTGVQALRRAVPRSPPQRSPTC